MKTNESRSVIDPGYIKYIVDGIKEILQFNMPVLWSWGAEGFRAGLFRGMVSLCFKVNGFLHKGGVVVAYNGGADLYEIYCLNEDDRIVKQREGVCFDELVEAIDRMVEKDCPQAEYEGKVTEWLGKSAETAAL